MALPRLAAVFPILVALSAGCNDDRDPFIAPGNPGGGPGGSGGGTGGQGLDAGLLLDAGAVARDIHGQICQVNDVRLGAACTPIDGTGLTVHVAESSDQAQVAADGTFTVAAPSGLVTLETNTNHAVFFGTGIQVGDGMTDVTMPIMSRDDVDTFLSQNFVTLVAGRGILVVHVTDNGDPAAGAVLSNLAADITPFYDAGDPLILAPIGPTGTGGTAVFFNAPTGEARFDVTSMGVTTSYFSFAANDAVSWALAVLPSP